MKLTILLLLISLSSFGQFKMPTPYNSTQGSNEMTFEIAADLTILGSAFVINEYRMQNKIGNERQTAMIAATSMGTCLVIHLLSNVDFKKKKHKKKRHRNFKLAFK